MAKKAVLITGGAKRIGAAMARYFAEHGYDIALHYHSSKKEALVLQATLKKQGVTCELFSHDLKNIKGIPALMKKVRAAMPHCVALINNASIFERAEFMKTDEALFDRQFAVNFKAPFFLTQAFAKTFGKGCVVNILDTDIAQTHVSHFTYLLAKKALANFTIMAARALGPTVRVNGVCPGYVLPHSTSDAVGIKKVEKNIPLKKHAAVEEITEAVLWISQQKHVTGQIMYIDGGKHVL